MGQCYYVELKLRPIEDKKEEMCEAFQKFLTGSWSDVQIDIDRIENTELTIDEKIESLLDLVWENIYSHGEMGKKVKFKLFTSAFDASYSRETTMAEAFKTLAPYLHNGSTMRVWPDSGCYSWKVRNGIAY